MKNNKLLDDLKSDYKKTNASWHLKISGWDDIAKKIGVRDPFYKRLFTGSLARLSLICVVIAILFIGSFKIVLASMPGETFYPVKLFSEKISKKITGNDQVAVEHRADEIIILSKESDKNTQDLKQVVIQYKESVIATQKQIQDSGRSEDRFTEKLEEQHKEFEKVSTENPEVGKDIKAATDIFEHSESEEDD